MQYTVLRSILFSYVEPEDVYQGSWIVSCAGGTAPPADIILQWICNHYVYIAYSYKISIHSSWLNNIIQTYVDLKPAYTIYNVWA